MLNGMTKMQHLKSWLECSSHHHLLSYKLDYSDRFRINWLLFYIPSFCLSVLKISPKRGISFYYRTYGAQGSSKTKASAHPKSHDPQIQYFRHQRHYAGHFMAFS